MPTMAEHADPPIMKLEMFSQPRLLAAARTMVGQLAQRLGFDDTQSGQISLALDEALCNVINHGYERRGNGRIWISIWDLSDDRPTLEIVIEDEARQVSPESIRSRELEDIRPGGLGVYIIREVMDDVHYEPRDTIGMRLIMRKTATDAPAEIDTENSEREAG